MNRLLFFLTLMSCLHSSHKELFAGNIPLEGLYPGFVLTLNGYQLTGQIGDITEMNGNHSVIFMNDFGSIYSYHPRMISGFFLKTETNSLFYESKYDGKNWLYLQLLFREKGVSLYQMPVDRIQWIYDKGMSRPFSYPVIEYFLDVSSLGNPIKLTRATYRKKLLMLFKKRNLDLASKIGKPGYRFQNLPEIIRQFTQSLLDKEKILL
ncbi:MAG: hypothetical protein ACOYN9_02870 [Saprospiraceae bacterium]